MKPTIQLDNVSMYYHDKNNVNIGISKISLSFYKGEFVCITGESGSGKTTLLNVLAAACQYHEGEVYYDGEPSSHFDDEDRETFRRNRIGYICQNYNLIDSYTLLENVTASMLIGGMSYSEAKVKALDYLDQVGLKEYADKRASKISSGQKQRLGIARALAKETDIILADEPTGNLDHENSIQIIEILKELSKDHLVIMVTHNIDDALPYASRVIRISDGHVVLDNKKEDVNLLDATLIEPKPMNPYKVAFTFSNFNRKAKPRRTILLSLFLLLVSLAVIALAGTIFANMDDTSCKYYDSRAFFNSAQNRILVQNVDGNKFTKDDLDKLNAVKYVVTSDLYDLVNDFNYYTEDDVYYNYNPRYAYDANGFPIEASLEEHKDPVWTNNNKFIMSTSAIKDEDILKGTKPSKVDEIAVYGDESLVGTKMIISLAERNEWANQTDYIQYEMTISCVLKPNEFVSKDQIYFSDKLCMELIYNMSADHATKLNYKLASDQASPDSKVRARQYERVVRIFSDDIGEGNIILSHAFFISGLREELYGKVALGHKIYVESPGEYQPISFEGQMSLYFVVVDDSYYTDLFNTFESNQISVYIEDYAYTDKVLNEIKSLGYEAFSTYRASTTTYNRSVLSQRNMTIVVCIVSIFVIFLLTLFVIVAFLSLNKKDYLLLRFLGMNKKMMYWTNFFEMIPTMVIMFLLSLIIILILNLTSFVVVKNIIRYMYWYEFIIIFLIVFLIVWATTHRFNRRLEKASFDFGGDKL